MNYIIWLSYDGTRYDGWQKQGNTEKTIQGKLERILEKLDGEPVDQALFDRIVDMLSLKEKLESMPNQLSGGQQQRVAIARALAARPSLLLADEPTGNLDSKTGQDVMRLMLETSRQYHQTILLITHNDQIARMADRVFHLEDGRIRL